MIESGFTIFLSHSLNILMDTSSYPWDLLISSVLIIFHISSSSRSKDDNLVLHFIFSFIHGRPLSSTVMTYLLTKFEKVLNSVSFNIFTWFLRFVLENNLFKSIKPLVRWGIHYLQVKSGLCVLMMTILIK